MLNRRNFFKLSAASAAAGVAGTMTLKQAKALPAWNGGKDFSHKTGRQRKAVPSACLQCVTRCPNIAYVEDGRVVKIEGQPNSIRSEGVMCAKGQGGVNQPNDPDRVLYPLRRVGARGEGKWKRVSWDEALGEVTARLQKLRDAGTPEKFMFHYGRMKASTSKMVGEFLKTFGTGTIGNHTSICEGGKWVAQEYTWGAHYDSWDFDNTRYVLNFGSNVLEAGTNHIPTSHRLIRAITDRNVKLVTFDVRLSNTAAKSKEWVPVKPGADLAVVLAMCNVVMNEDLYKGDGEAFLQYCKATAKHDATTAEKIASLKAHFAPYTPQWAAKISAVPAETIARIAREFATTHPACVISYRGAIAHYNGHDTERAIQTLAAITGNIDNPGGRCKAVGPKWHYPKGISEKPKARKLDILDGPKGAAVSPNHHMSHNVLKMIKDGSNGRPDIYMTYMYTPVYANGEVQENIDILKDETLVPFFVSVNPFYDESAALADLILPEPTYTERWDWEDMVSPTQVAEFYIRQPAIKPLGDCRDFATVACDLAERLGTPLGFKTKEEFVRLSCEKTPEVAAVGGFEYMKAQGVYHDPKAKPRYHSYKVEVSPAAYQKDTVVYDPQSGVYWDWKKVHVVSREEALKKGYTHTKHAYKGYVGHRVGDKVYSGFKPDKVNTSGYFEIYSSIMEDKGLAPLPTWVGVPEHENMGADDMMLTTYKVATQIHSRSQNCKFLTEVNHDNPAWINPKDAQRRGIKDGDKVKITSPVGGIETEAKVTPAVNIGVVAISHHFGHWQYGRYASGHKAPEGRDDDPDLQRIWWKDDRGVHPNWMIANSPDPINGELRWMDTVVQVRKA
ncbi:molybdopterin-containing oxidoreductase family protein [Varunaivibrio sulfuroxidans]|uniref:Anaerobic selenocysteine-containing dehydrogenase n=1 Tax=Varunaivibrio sulfuroxidans TaxID=1773489 RepID=A0A4R3J3Z2_9PROT|nr:molybdopterin-dependent oxidoreductase [Varunaivibrio sulfuroxidans]TCS60559.1 anaerobic selenocysteine-containing dehydrogenase [Varunaivibrio sulfuroxidans]WES30049.1 molybdopterin-dependent oxidoreductase [Varunaivibrio sulfuroxidans]